MTKPSKEAKPSKEDIDDAADDLIEAANYLQETLNAGGGVLESQWLGPVMRAHELLLSMADADDQN